MNAPHHNFRVSNRLPRERSTAKRIERWLTLFAGLLLAYTVFCFIALEGWK
jgi:hypothetical protein